VNEVGRLGVKEGAKKGLANLVSEMQDDVENPDALLADLLYGINLFESLIIEQVSNPLDRQVARELKKYRKKVDQRSRQSLNRVIHKEVCELISDGLPDDLYKDVPIKATGYFKVVHLIQTIVKAIDCAIKRPSTTGGRPEERARRLLDRQVAGELEKYRKRVSYLASLPDLNVSRQSGFLGKVDQRSRRSLNLVIHQEVCELISDGLPDDLYKDVTLSENGEFEVVHLIQTIVKAIDCAIKRPSTTGGRPEERARRLLAIYLAEVFESHDIEIVRAYSGTWAKAVRAICPGIDKYDVTSDIDKNLRNVLRKAKTEREGGRSVLKNLCNNPAQKRSG